MRTHSIIRSFLANGNLDSDYMRTNENMGDALTKS